MDPDDVADNIFDAGIHADDLLLTGVEEIAHVVEDAVDVAICGFTD